MPWYDSMPDDVFDDWVASGTPTEKEVMHDEDCDYPVYDSREICEQPQVRKQAMIYVHNVAIGQGFDFAMSTRNRKGKQMVNRTEVIREQMKRLEAELYRLERFGPDRYDDGSVIKFDKTFAAGYGSDERGTYTFAAIKAEGYWYLSGPKFGGQKMLWDELIDWMGDGVKTIHFLSEITKTDAASGE